MRPLKQLKLPSSILRVTVKESPLDKFWKVVLKKYPKVNNVSSVWISHEYQDKLVIALKKHAKLKYKHLSKRGINSTVGMALLQWGPAAYGQLETGIAYINK